MNLALMVQYALELGIALVVTYLCTLAVMAVAPRLGLMDHPGGRHGHARATPRAGGVAVFLGFHAGCAALFFWLDPGFSGSLDRDWWLRFLLPSSALLGLGLADDKWNLRPGIKLAGQVAVALLAYAGGIRLDVLFRTPISGFLNLALTVGWFLAIVNAFNLIDGIDGLATGLALVASVGLVLALVVQLNLADIAVVLSLAGACLAFLRHNFHPARIFLGDSGSLFLGFTLAAMALTTTSKNAVVSSLLVPLLAFGVPLFDSLLAVWRRSVRPLRPGESRASALFGGDSEHLHHRLSRNGRSQRKVALLLYLASGSLVAAGLLLTVFRSHVTGIALTAFVGGLYVMARHLAHVELWHTGTALLRGLRRPPRRVVVVLLYPLADALAMGCALAIALRLFPDGEPGSEALRWLRAGSVWVAVPFLVLALSGTYRQVWSRAGAGEYAVLLAVMAGGLLLAAGLASLIFNLPDAMLLKYLSVFGGLSVLAVVGLRTVRPVLSDLLIRPWHGRTGHPGRRRLLLYGTGDQAMLFLHEQRFAALDAQDSEQVVGLLADDSNLHGRMIHGIPVIGGLAFLGQQAARLKPDEVVVARDLSPEAMSQLLETARRLALQVSEWRTERRSLTDPKGRT